MPFVVSNPYTGIREAVEELVRLGHRCVGYVSHPSLGSFSVNERETAFRAVASDMLIEGNGVVVACDSTYESRTAAVESLLDAGVSAMLCAYSPDALTMIGVLHDRGVSIGEDMSLVSFDDIAAFTLMTPRIAVVSQQAELMGRQGVDLLLCRIRSGASDEGVTHSVPTMFINRGSVKQGPSAAVAG